MRLFAAATLAAACAIAIDGCGTRLVKQYEYEEEMYLDLDGSATVMVNTSVPALVALRGAELPTAPRARLNREAIRRFYESPVTRVTRVSRPWRREGRRFVHVRMEVTDVRRLADAAPFAWSTYRFAADDNLMVFRQRVAGARNVQTLQIGWDGSELVAFRMHLPSRIEFHSLPSELQRGNILVWEQTLAERLRGEPIDIEVRMGSESILARTLSLFATAFGAAIALLGALVWWTMRRAPRSGQP
jgi:hypothetical protein